MGPRTALSRTGSSARTVLDHFRSHVQLRGDRPALRFRNGDDWSIIDWATYGKRVDDVAAGLADRGILPGDRVAILSSNRPEWHIADLAVMSIGAVTVPLYPTAAPAQIAYLLGHARVRACVAEDVGQLERVLASDPKSFAHLELVVTLTADQPPPERTTEPMGVAEALGAAETVGFATLEARGNALLLDASGLVEERRDAIRADDLATIVYTSGTTGPPRGALITHRNLVATVAMITEVLPIGPGDRFLSFLPLSHIAERIVSHMGQLVSGGETWFAQSMATVAADLLVCRPTIFFAVPRVWEKTRDALESRLQAVPKPLRLLIDLQRRVIERADHGNDLDRSLRRPVPLAVRQADRFLGLVLDRTIGHTIRRRLGLGHARLLLSGAAPIDDELVRWLRDLGIRVGQVYGQTEVCGPTSMSRPGRIRIGTVGAPLPGEEVQIADDGEVLVRGPNVCVGYLDDPVRTRELIDSDGWLHTGDVGRFEPDGELRITGRKKDLIATSQGKKIAPQAIENRLRADRLVSQAVVIGEGRPYLVALITIDADAAAERAAGRGRAVQDAAATANDEDVLRDIAEVIATVNHDLSPPEQIKRWSVLPRDLTVDAGELTPTLKVVRPVVTARNADRIDALYGRDVDGPVTH